MSSHTPGPWRVEILPGGKRGSAAQIMIASPIPIKPIICGIPHGTDEHMANMRLIAAAPELLAALVGLLELGRKDTSNPKYDGYYETARAAIAKAEAQSE